jgi:RNA polymerase sigma-70 factor (ECF subfamily)
MTSAVRADLEFADAGIISRAANGDANAFDYLIRPRLDRLYRMAYAITGNETDARDAVQDASVSAWRALPSLRDHRRFDSWLSQILVNACRAVLRGRRRVEVREIPAVDIAGDSPRYGRAEPIAHDTTDRAGEAEAIRRAFRRLDPTSRSLLVLHYVEERPLAEIARVLGSPVGTVKWRLSRARQALNRALEAERR